MDRPTNLFYPENIETLHPLNTWAMRFVPATPPTLNPLVN